MEAASLILEARHSAGLTQVELAARAGISRYTLSHYERGRRVPTIATLEIVLAAAGRQLRVDLELLNADVRAAIERQAAEPIGACEAAAAWEYLTWMSRLEYRFEGLAAANLLGAPVPVDVIDIGVADEPATFEALALWLRDEAGMLRSPDMPRYEMWHPEGDPKTAGETMTRIIGDSCPDRWFWIRAGLHHIRLRLSPSASLARYVRLSTPHGSIKVQPFHEIESPGASREVARVLGVMRDWLTEQATATAATATAAAEPERPTGTATGR
ncbi:helix-turn-helix domain-containing protein [Phytoactinopolyspora mesophila]|uniref:Helix-turn-helix domain-containing protein n=1 Tax=Phytoactinopolyspora mesophila TaxID=2650750 RepID=A0A7K3MBT3_9ACTN|nr:helix-turn-helix transcriptional regulator [Phytoactinopolyspora mesophila]NDL60785.1 helix-turn-helix domain-containing protein [Phytoactinopolyspora mesophila]